MTAIPRVRTTSRYSSTGSGSTSTVSTRCIIGGPTSPVRPVAEDPGQPALEVAEVVGGLPRAGEVPERGVEDAPRPFGEAPRQGEARSAGRRAPGTSMSSWPSATRSRTRASGRRSRKRYTSSRHRHTGPRWRGARVGRRRRRCRRSRSRDARRTGPRRGTPYSSHAAQASVAACTPRIPRRPERTPSMMAARCGVGPRGLADGEQRQDAAAGQRGGLDVGDRRPRAPPRARPARPARASATAAWGRTPWTPAGPVGIGSHVGDDEHRRRAHRRGW